MYGNYFVEQQMWLFSYTFKKNTSNNTTLTLQEVGGYLNPSYFVDGMRTSHNFALAITKLMISTPKVFLLFCLPLFSIEMNQNVNS